MSLQANTSESRRHGLTANEAADRAQALREHRPWSFSRSVRKETTMSKLFTSTQVGPCRLSHPYDRSTLYSGDARGYSDSFVGRPRPGGVSGCPGSFLSGGHRGLQRPNFHAMQSWMSQYSGLPIAKADLL
jgi:hypothetical protein